MGFQENGQIFFPVVGSKIKVIYGNPKDPKDHLKNKLCKHKSYGIKVNGEGKTLKNALLFEKMPLHVKVNK